jgi:hypothetical protein
MKFKVKTLNDDNVEVKKLEIMEATKTRPIIAIGTFATCLLFLGGAAFYGIKRGEFSSLETVLTYVQPIMGAIIGYYFGSKHG